MRLSADRLWSRVVAILAISPVSGHVLKHCGCKGVGRPHRTCRGAVGCQARPTPRDVDASSLALAVGDPHHLPTVEMPDPSSIRRSSARPFPASHPAGRRAGLKTSGLPSDVAPAARGDPVLGTHGRRLWPPLLPRHHCSSSSHLATPATCAQSPWRTRTLLLLLRARVRVVRPLSAANLRSRPQRSRQQSCLPACSIRTRYHHSRREP